MLGSGKQSSGVPLSPKCSGMLKMEGCLQRAHFVCLLSLRLLGLKLFCGEAYLERNVAKQKMRNSACCHSRKETRERAGVLGGGAAWYTQRVQLCLEVWHLVIYYKALFIDVTFLAAGDVMGMVWLETE